MWRSPSRAAQHCHCPGDTRHVPPVMLSTRLPDCCHVVSALRGFQGPLTWYRMTLSTMATRYTYHYQYIQLRARCCGYWPWSAVLCVLGRFAEKKLATSRDSNESYRRLRKVSQSPKAPTYRGLMQFSIVNCVTIAFSTSTRSRPK